MILVKRLHVWLIVLLASGCGSIDPVLEDPHIRVTLDSLANDIESGHSDAELLHLSDELKHQLEARVDPVWGDTKKFLQLSEHFFSASERGIQYDAGLSRTAEQTYQARRGNCLSMSSLFVAAARHLQLESHFQVVEVRPSWINEGETMIRYEHIVAAGDLGSSSYVVDFLPQLVGERGPRRTITDEQALALYYSNLAVKAIVAGDMTEGIQKSLQAIKLWPKNSNAWSNLGAAYRRAGNKKLAEASYRRALQLDRHNNSALSNLTRFYLSEDRDDEAESYLRAMSRYYRKNPYYYVQLAQMRISAGDYEQAKLNLERASRVKKNDPKLHDALSDIYRKINDMAASDFHVEQAERIRQKQKRLSH